MNIGDKAKDIITGFTGIIDAKSTYLNGCVQVSIQPSTLSKEKKIRKSEWFDVGQVKVIKKKAVIFKVMTLNSGLKLPTLGDRVKDSLTGYTGIVVASADYQSGRIGYSVQSQKLDGDSIPDAEWFDASRIIIVKKAVVVTNIVSVKEKKVVQRAPGGPQRTTPPRF